MTAPVHSAGETVALPPQTSTHPEPGGRTPAQTIGPFFRGGMAWMNACDLVGSWTPGALVLTGVVSDGAGAPVPDAVVEIWQADATGRFRPAEGSDDEWSGFGRSLTDGAGRYRFTTVAPGPVDAEQAPHIDFTIFARGLLQRLVTRLYLPDEVTNDTDPVLIGLAEDRRRTLVASTGSWESHEALLFDIRLQGPGETVFFVW